MADIYFGANLIDYFNINVFLFSSLDKPDKTPINLIINNSKVVKLDVVKQVFYNGISIYTCQFREGFKLGNSYKISIENYGLAPLNVSPAIDFASFDDEFSYNGDDLGCTYTKEKTIFKIWAPLSSGVSIFLRAPGERHYSAFRLTREEKGVYSITLEGDYENYRYLYSVTNNEMFSTVTDPYAKGSTANGKESVVIDFDKVKIDLCEDKLPTYKNYTDTIIYELHVRDFTIDSHTNIESKGKYLGIAEKGRTTEKGNEAGLDYLKKIGITHVQLLPIYDFKTADELNPDEKYNRGYDPQQYFVPEGSYSTNPNDGYSRIIELKKMIAALHNEGIKVNMDVVYNHVYEGLFSTFEKVVPGYYFRKQKNGALCNGSGCGNDVASERPMVRKMILDCSKYWMNEYGIDGFRFDLMGLLDVDLINQIVLECRKVKKDFMVYGEGWDMNTNLPSDKKASILNAFKMPNVAFFNDSFRDILKGPNGEDKTKTGGYLSGNLSYVEGFKFSLLGSCLNFVYPARFLTSSQSINYVECHDNFSLFDKLSFIYGDDVDKILHIIKEINGAILLSFGIPFFHSGQEIGLSKLKADNTYNLGDEYNKFRWDVLDERIDMVQYFLTMINFRKSAIDINETNPDKIGKMNSFETTHTGLLIYNIADKNKKEFKVIFNPTDENISYELDDYYLMVAETAGYITNSAIYVKVANVLNHSVFVFEKKVN